MRVIVTGSRDWHDARVIEAMLDRFISRDRPGILVHGACPTGADYHAQHWALGKPWVKVERFRADWRRLGAAAGPERNKRMVAAGGDVVLAFIGVCTQPYPRCKVTDPHPSHGASGCAALGEAAGIKVYRTYARPDVPEEPRMGGILVG